MDLAVPVSFARLDEAVRRAPPHLKPVWRAARDQGCEVAIIVPGGVAFDPPPSKRPLITMIADDLDAAYGPVGFDGASLRRIIRRCAAAAVVSSGPDVRPYSAACTNAVLFRQDVLIIETRPEQEIPWVQLLQDVKPGIRLMICTVPGGTA